MASTYPPKRLYRIPRSTNAEDPELYKAFGFHPVHIGDYLKGERYRIVHKLGYGGSSTVWLARDCLENCYVSLKISRANFALGNKEVSVLRHLAQTKSDHMGAQYVMRLRDDFILSGPNGEHQCIVSQVAGNRLSRPLGVRYSCLGPSRLLVAQLFLGLEYLNSCNVGHGDLYTGNILFQLETFDSWSDEQLYECMGRPVTEEVVRLDGQAIESCAPAYTVHSGDLSRLEQRMMVSKILIVDFGASYFINKPPLKTTTPAQYAAPEVLRSIEVAPSSDVWALGCAAFEICAGYTMFKALFNPRQDVMKDMISMLGKPPDNIWKMWEERSRYFDEEGHAVRRTEQVIPFQTYPLYDRVRDMARLYPTDGRMIDMSELPGEHLETVELVQTHDFLSKVFVFNPVSRISVQSALGHPFLAQVNIQ